MNEEQQIYKINLSLVPQKDSQVIGLLIN
jgi:hypothetical protein